MSVRVRSTGGKIFVGQEQTADTRAVSFFRSDCGRSVGIYLGINFFTAKVKTAVTRIYYTEFLSDSIQLHGDIRTMLFEEETTNGERNEETIRWRAIKRDIIRVYEER